MDKEPSEKKQDELERAAYLTVQAVVVRATKAEKALARIAAILKEAGY